MSEATEGRRSLLPANKSLLEGGLDLALAHLVERIAPPFPELMNPQQTPLAFLPYLAADRGVSEWDAAAPEQEKRDTVADTWQTHRLAGTREALLLTFRALGLVPEVVAWHEQTPRGEPYSYNLIGEIVGPYDALRDARLEARLQAAKAERDYPTLQLFRRTGAPVGAAVAITAADTADLIYPQRYVIELAPRETQINRLDRLVNKTLPEAFNG